MKMEAKKLNQVNLGVSTFGKRVRLVQNGVARGTVIQPVSMNPSSKSLIQLGYNGQPVISVVEDENQKGVYKLRLLEAGTFFIDNKKGTHLFDFNGKNELILDPNKSSITMSNRSEELRFEIEAEDEKKYVITTGAFGINIQVEDENGVSNYSYRIPNLLRNEIPGIEPEGIGVEIHPQLMEEFLNPDKKLCKFKYPSKNNEVELLPTMKSSPAKALSVDLFASFIQTLEPGTTVDFTDSNDIEHKNGYYVSLLPDQGELNKDGKNRPPAFITQFKDGKRSNYLFVNGYFRHCDNYRLMSETDEKGVTHPFIALETGASTHVFYKYELPVNNDGTLSPEAVEILDFVRNGVFMAPPFNTPQSSTERSSDNVSAYVVELPGKDGKPEKNTFYFEKRDSRESDKIKDYDIRRLTNEIIDEDPNDPNTIDEDPEEPNAIEPQSPTGDNTPIDPQQEQQPQPVPPGQEQQPQPESPEQRQQPDKPKEQRQAIEQETPEPPTDTTFNISQPVEAVSTTMCIIGIFLFLGAMLTGGLSLIAGLVVFGVGFSGVLTADLYNFGPIKRAQKRVKQYEKEEKEDKKEEEKQNENEVEADKEDEQATESENALNKQIKNEFDINAVDADENQIQNRLTNEMNLPENGFASLYEKYGILPTEEGQKIDALTSFDGLEARRQMLSQLSAIQTASPTEREQRVNDFINSNFLPMPDEDRKLLTEGEGILANTPEAQTKLNTFVSALHESVAHGERKQELLDQQTQFVSTARDSTLERFMTSSSITPEQREKRFIRYASVIARRYANDQDLTEGRISRLLSKLPENERTRCANILEDARVAITSQVSAVQQLARDNAAQTAQLSQASALVHAIEAVQKQTTFGNKNQVEADAQTYMQHSLYSAYETNSVNKLTTLKTNATKVAGATTEEKALLDALTRLYDAESGLRNDIGDKYGDINNILSANYGNLLTDAYLHPDIVESIREFPATGKKLKVDGNAIGTNNDPINKIVDFVTARARKEGSPDAAEINLLNNLNNYNQLIDQYRTAAVSHLIPAVNSTFNIPIDVAWRNTPINSVNVKKEIDALTAKYGKAFTGLNDPSTTSTMSIQERIARAVLTERALNSSCPPNVRNVYSQLSQAIDFVLSGNFANAQVAEAIRANSAATFAGKKLGDDQKKLQGDIAAYNATTQLLATLPAQVRNTILASYNTSLRSTAGLTPKQAMIQSIRGAFDAMDFEGKEQFEPLMDDLVSPQTIGRIDALLGAQRQILENRAQIQRSLFRQTLGRESVESVYTSTFENRAEHRQPKVAQTGLSKKEQEEITNKRKELANFDAQSLIIEYVIQEAVNRNNFRYLEKLLENKNNYTETFTTDWAPTVNVELCQKYLAQIGLNPSTLKHILKLSPDKRWNEFNKLCNNAKISERLTAIRTNIDLELKTLTTISNLSTRKDRQVARNLYDSTQRLCDIKSFKTAVDQIGKAKYVDNQTWTDFALQNEALLKRLGIKPESLKDPKTRAKYLKKVSKELDKKESKATKRYNKIVKKEEKDRKRTPSADMSRRSAKNIQESMTSFGKILSSIRTAFAAQDAAREAAQQPEIPEPQNETGREATSQPHTEPEEERENKDGDENEEEDENRDEDEDDYDFS